METISRPANAASTARSSLALPLLLLGATLLSVSCGAPERLDVAAFAGAIQVNEPDHAAWVAALSAAGLDSLQVTVYARQQAWNSSAMILPTEAPAVIDEVRTARRAGLRVVLVLRMALEQGLPENRHLWHGMIWPPEGQVQAWFDNYRRFVDWGARLAQQERVDLLAIGSELNSLTSTVQVAELPDLYSYFLDAQRTAAVRARLVDCAAKVPAASLQPDLQFVDGAHYDSLDAYLRDEEEAHRAWATIVAGAADGDAADLTVLNRRRARYDRLWRQLIDAARSGFSGPITYAANFDAVEEVGFWDALDAIGVNAYYPLSRWGLSGAALDDELAASWRGIGSRLGELAAAAGSPAHPLPVVLLELGWTTRAGSTVRPYSYHRVEVLETVGRTFDGRAPLTCVHWATQQQNPQERVQALEALLRVVREGGFPTLRGFMLWKLTTQPRHRGIEPFAVLLSPQQASADLLASTAAAETTGADVEVLDAADRDYLGVAAELAKTLHRNADKRR
ncbi:MAG: hypothetical protein ACE5HV_10150 [Acidobacteriota bacterium]